MGGAWESGNENGEKKDSEKEMSLMKEGKPKVARLVDDTD
jgi:hypothetical protein